MSPPPTTMPLTITAGSTSLIPHSDKDTDTPTVRFTNARDLVQLIDNTPGDFLTVTHVSPTDFIEIQRERETRGRNFRFRRYQAASQVLIITIPGDLHERLHSELYGQFRDELKDHGLQRKWLTIASATRRASSGHPNADGGEGDSTGGPYPERRGIGDWPTLVIEAGDSESLHDLRADMRWWFLTSDHRVKIVLLAKFDHRQKTILLEKWEEEAQIRAGATTTRSVSVHQPALQPVCRQEIKITRTGTNPPVYDVTRGALVLGFRLLFLRDPGPEEGDIGITVEGLQWYAEVVWSAVPEKTR